ncbi:protein DpdJ [Sorangium sp. So ce281]|uniref:protein DpdJ n=1 Tax=unclassified Sorangium TaxID=2621164 RepID=UPI003F6308A3
MNPNEHAIEFLDWLEQREATLLAWGLTDGFFAEHELEHHADAFLEELVGRGVDPGYASGWELVDALTDGRLLWKLPGSDRYRTRMAEAVRLFARLRQIFPDPRHGAWRSAPNLVADYRLLLRAREYPKRDVAPDAAITTLRSEVRLTPLQEGVVRALLRTGASEQLALSGFQVRASVRVLRTTGTGRSVGTVVCAGTGSGKTLAFYLPAYAAIAPRLSGDPWTKCLAIYPRSELLKDQFREAMANARRIVPALQAANTRKLVLGALYGDVPTSGSQLLTNATGANRSSWRRFRLRDGWAFECPYLRCPRCNEPMVWPEALVRQRVESLVCTAGSCNESIAPDEIRLTRERMLDEPPDVLFATTEMLNQRMSSARYRHLFGVGVAPERRLNLVLLDEAHTYEGVHGAHVALLLRRWRRLADNKPHFVGLSATLAEAPSFFADLVGVGRGDVAEISPHPGELRPQGMEYMLALRGDPASGTSLLSTSIQTALLLRRVLAPQRRQPYFGSRVFAFTDNLDVTNRLFHSLLDAEGWDPFGRPNPQRPGGSLANLRASTLPGARERLDAGQNWTLAEDAGHTLAPGARARVGRTSSQDAGVDATAETVIATSALEVGFDDPDVGAVLQHKAPHSAAAFMQRKGRAGRRRDMRPWTVVVLSDYGRDRSAYQAYERTFSPALPPRRLPLGNRVVLRMQATYALLDWLARGLPQGHSPEPWTDLAQPADSRETQLRERQRRYAELLRLLLDQPEQRTAFTNFMARALDVDPDTVTALLWEPPRALLTEAVPTLLRRLERNWKRADGSGPERHSRNAPLPEFVPRALFSDLNLPEVTVRLPAHGRTPAREEPMPLAQALREFAPGRVSRRFGVLHAFQRYWVSPDRGNDVSIDRVCPREDRHDLGVFSYQERAHVVQVPVFRPHALDVTVPPADIQVSSNAFLDWRAEIVPAGKGHEVDLPAASSWSAIIQPLRFHTHHLGLPIELRRFATGARASIARRGSPSLERRLRFVCEAPGGGTQPAALGLVADVDAIEVRFRYPPRLHEQCRADVRLVRGLRPARFRELVRAATNLDGVANTFQRDWLSQAYLSTVTAEALLSGTGLADAEAAVHDGTSRTSVAEVIETILQWAPEDGEADDDDDGESDGAGPGARPRRLQELLDIIALSTTREALHEAASVLWAPIDDRWEPWLQARFKATLGAAMVEAAYDLCPRMDPGTLILDLDARPRPSVTADDSTDELWLTEAIIGGGGFVEEFLTHYAADPRHYLRLLEATLGASDLEHVGDELARIVAWAGSPGQHPLHPIFAAVRGARTHDASARALDELRMELSRCGVAPTPTLLVSLHARLLRPGSNARTDSFLAACVRDWHHAEVLLGVDVDARVFAFARSHDDALEQALQVAPPDSSDRMRAAWRYGVLMGMLWPRGAQVRAESLRAHHPFASIPECDRLLVLAALRRSPPVVELDDGPWFEGLAQALLGSGSAELVTAAEQPARLAEALLRLACEPIDADTLLVHPRVTGVRREGERLITSIELPEAIQ